MRTHGLRDLFRFSKPKTPGYGLWEGFYMTVLCARAPLPAPLVVANPKGEGGAVAGMIAPLEAGASKDQLTHPLSRGIYGVASPNQKTVLEMRILSISDTQFHPDSFVDSLYALELTPDAVARIRGTWSLAQFRFCAHDPMVRDSLAFLHGMTRRLGELTDGVVADPLAERYLLWEQMPRLDPTQPLQAVDHLTVRPSSNAEAGAMTALWTHGLRKFGQPELVLRDVPEHGVPRARRLLLSVAQTMLDQGALGPGDQIAMEGVRWTLADSGDPPPAVSLELLPPTGALSSDWWSGFSDSSK